MTRTKKPAAPSTSANERVRGKKRLAVLDRGGNRCVYCGEGDAVMTVDHVVPAAAGGKSIASNLVCACESCNGAKADWDLDQFCERLRRRKDLDPAAIMFRVIQQTSKRLKV